MRRLVTKREDAPEDQAVELAALCRSVQRLGIFSSTPRTPHLEIALGELLPLVAGALEEQPDAAAYLARVPLSTAFLALHFIAGRALRIPVALRGSQEDWAAAATLLRPRGGDHYSQRHAARVWSHITRDADGVRALCFTASRGCRKGRLYQFAFRCRRDGTPFPSSSRIYSRAYRDGLSYVTCDRLLEFSRVELLEEAARALSFKVPKVWRAARSVRLRRKPELRRVPYARQITRSIEDLRAEVRTAEIRRHFKGRRARVRERVISKTYRSAVKNQKGPPPGDSPQGGGSVVAASAQSPVQTPQRKRPAPVPEVGRAPPGGGVPTSVERRHQRGPALAAVLELPPESPFRRALEAERCTTRPTPRIAR